MTLAREGLTLEAFLALPEEKPALEYIDRTVRQKAASGLAHSALQAGLSTRLYSRLEPTRLARVFPELRTTYSGASRVPDVAVYRWERVPRDAAGRLAEDAFTPPDLAIEILSPGQSTRHLVNTCQWFVEHGARVALFVHPRQQSVRVFRPNSPVSVHRRGDRISLDEIAPGLELDLDEIFSALDPD
jgi:Uma2 family endonuclease